MELDKREKFAMVCAFVALWLCFALAIFIPTIPMKKYRKSESLLQEKQQELKMTMVMKQSEEERLRGQEKLMELLTARTPGFDLLSFVNNIAKESNLVGRFSLENFKTRQGSPKQPMVELKLQGVALEELVDLLHKIHSSNNLVAVYKLDRFHPASGNKGLDIEMILATVKT